jgi:hypothetical protein
LPVLRIAAGIVVGVYLDVLHATLGSVEFGSPGTVYQFHTGELDQRKATPDPRIAARQWSTLGFSPVLITERSPLVRPVVAHHMRTQEPTGTVIPRRDGPVLNRRRSHKAVNFLWRLFGGRARSTHSFRIASLCQVLEFTQFITQ